MNKDRLEILIAKFHNKELSDNEKHEFESLLKNSAEARESFHRWNFVSQSIDAFNIHEDIDIEEILPKTTSHRIGNKRKYRWIINIAAAITIPLLLAVGHLYNQLESDKAVLYNEVTCSSGKVITILLCDSSNVRLFAGSTLRYPSHFKADSRDVYLKGEASFDVKANPEYPFTVTTENGYKVKAYGTKFNVQDYRQSDNILVYLDHGIVDFESPTLDSKIIISPNTELSHRKNSNLYTLKKIGSKEYDAYERGVLVFNNRHIHEVVQKLEKVYNIEIEIENNEKLKNYRFTATFRNESIYHILNILKISSPGLDWKEKDGKIILTNS